MIPTEEALAIVLEHAQAMGTERLPLADLPGRYLAEPVLAQTDVPLFDNSAVDGYGVRLADVAGASPASPTRLRLCTPIRAGDAAGEDLPPGFAVKVLTGAPIPRGVEAMVMREHCEESPDVVGIRQAPRPGENIRRRGEEFCRGDQALPAGVLATPPVIGLLAALGYSAFEVHQKPRVAVVITGSELVSPGEPLRPGQIYDSNSFTLGAALAAMGLRNSPTVRAPDNRDLLHACLATTLENSDVVLTVGGVSVGDYDLVKDTCQALGVATRFWQVAIKPGKPLYFGTRTVADGGGEQLVFGLPGNPVAAAVTFHVFVRPALLRMMGAADVSPRRVLAVLAHDLRKKPGREEFVRGRLGIAEGRLVARATTGQDSHMLGGLAEADCLIRFPLEAAFLPAGETVTIELLSWA